MTATAMREVKERMEIEPKKDQNKTKGEMTKEEDHALVTVTTTPALVWMSLCVHRHQPQEG